MYKDFKISKTQNYPLGVYFRHAGLHIAAVHRRTPGNDPAEFGIILYDKKHRNGARIPFPEEGRVGSVYAMLLEGYQNREFSYLFYCGDKVWQDPYCRKTEYSSKYGVPGKALAHCMVPDTAYDWEEDKAPGISYENTVLYALHVRGFTKHKSSGVKHRGTYAGLTEKIPYLKELGITSLVLMPSYEFDEIQVQANISAALSMEQAAASYKQTAGNGAENAYFTGTEEKPWKINYWGFCRGLYYCPKSGYAHSRDAVTEYKDMVRELHRNGIEVLMQFYFPPEVASVDMLDILKYWTVEYHIDGFHVLGVDLPIGMFAEEPLLSGTKLLTIQQYCPPESTETMRNVGWLSEGFMYDIRRLLKGDDNMINRFIFHVRNNRPEVGIINYIAKWEGFCLADLVSYDRKHNEDNGEDNRDGTDYNCSWNCGVEGRSRKKYITQLRMKQMKNALTMVFLAQGTPLLYNGDEFGNSQGGNNNPYCQDNAVTWIKWNQMESNGQLLDYTRMLIDLRRSHPVLHSPMPLKGMDYLSCGYPDISFHGREAWRPDTSPVSRTMGIMYCGYYGEIDGHRDEDFIYFGINLHWEKHSLGLPKLPRGKVWKLCVSTDSENQTVEKDDGNLQEITLAPRTIVIYTTKDCPVFATGTHRRKRGRTSVDKSSGEGAAEISLDEDMVEKKDFRRSEDGIEGTMRQENLSMNKAWQHFKTITQHKRLVMEGCFKVGLYRQGILHDLSKFSPEEFMVGARYWQGNRSPNNAEREAIGYSSAWLHHKGRNKHHYEYWIDYSCRGIEGGMAPAPMPKRYIVEMFMDRVAACKVYHKDAYTDRDPLLYYQSSQTPPPLHPRTKNMLEFLLRMLAKQGEEKTFRYIRTRILKNPRVG